LKAAPALPPIYPTALTSSTTPPYRTHVGLFDATQQRGGASRDELLLARLMVLHDLWRIGRD